LKIVLATNSQGTAAGIGVSKAYPVLVVDSLAERDDVSVLAMTGFSVRDFNVHIENILLQKPDLVVLQIGIVECARRILSVREKEIIEALPYRLRRRLTKAMHDRRQRVILLRERLGRTTRLYTIEEFRTEIRSFRERLAAVGAEVLLLEIPRFAPAYEAEHFPLVNEDIDIFNRVLRDEGAAVLLGGDDVAQRIWQSGTVHLTEAGHALAAERLLALIDGKRRIV
jgi:hypothetical protein